MDCFSLILFLSFLQFVSRFFTLMHIFLSFKKRTKESAHRLVAALLYDILISVTSFIRMWIGNESGYTYKILNLYNTTK